MLNLRDDTGVWARNIFCPKVDRMETAHTVPAFVPQKRQNPWKRSSPAGGDGRTVRPGVASLYMRARRRQCSPHARAQEPRSKTHHGPPVAPPARAWCVLFRVSRAREPMCHRSRGLRGRASHPKVSFGAVEGNPVLHGNLTIFVYSWVSQKRGVQ